MKHIIFDLDGTLIDSKNEIAKTYLKVFDEIIPEKMPDVEALNYSLTLNDLLKTVYVVDLEKVPLAKRKFAEIYDTSYFFETTIYKGVYETLTRLKKHGAEMYIATNKRLAPTKRILELKKMDHFFNIIMANEMEPGITMSKRQMIAGIKKVAGFEDGFMVGDAESDIKSGNEEGLKTVAVTYGYELKYKLEAQNPLVLIDHFEKLEEFVFSF